MDACPTSPTSPAAPGGPDLLRQIEARLPQLSPIMRSIGGYCVRSHAWLHQTSIDEVADRCGTVPSSVVRFARLFGHKGFHDFKRAFLDRGVKPVDGSRDDPSGPHAKLLSHLDEDVHHLSDLRTLLQDDAFRVALDWIREQPRLSLSFHGELDRMVAMQLGDALQRGGKFVLMIDQCQARAQQLADAAVTCIHLDLERPRLHAERSFRSGSRSGVGSGGHQIHLLGTDRLHGPNVSVDTLTLPVFGCTLGRRLQKALSIANTIESALH
jgi:Helix-turn-helix domain, rpiR family